MGVLRSVRGAAWGYTRVQRRAAAVPGMSAVGISDMIRGSVSEIITHLMN